MTTMSVEAINSFSTCEHLHIWDVFAAPLVTVRQATSKLSQGWRLFALSQTYGSSTSLYSKILRGPYGELAQLTDRTVNLLPSQELAGLIQLHCDVVALRVSYEDKNQVKELGAIWSPIIRNWVCRTSDTLIFESWLPPQAVPLDLLTLK